MKRRTVLSGSSVGLVTAVAGCSQVETGAGGGARDSDGAGSDENEPESTDDEAESRETDDDAPDASTGVEIRADELVVEDGEFSIAVYVEAIVENRQERASGPLELDVEWHDADGTRLGSDVARLDRLDADGVWEARIHYRGWEGEAITAYEFDAGFEDELDESAVDGVTVRETELRTDGSTATLGCAVENRRGEPIGYLRVVATVADEDGVVVGNAFTVVTELAAGETRSVDVTWYDRRRAGRVAEFDVTLVEPVS